MLKILHETINANKKLLFLRMYVAGMIQAQGFWLYTLILASQKCGSNPFIIISPYYMARSTANNQCNTFVWIYSPLQKQIHAK